MKRRPKKKFHSNRFTNQKLVEDIGDVLQDIVSMVVAHEARIAEGQSSNFSGSNNIFDFIVDTCNKKLAANPLPLPLETEENSPSGYNLIDKFIRKCFW